MKPTERDMMVARAIATPYLSEADLVALIEALPEPAEHEQVGRTLWTLRRGPMYPDHYAEHEQAAQDAVIDCGDNSCLFATRRGGMRTNGGCRCIERLLDAAVARERERGVGLANATVIEPRDKFSLGWNAACDRIATKIRLGGE